MPGLCSKTRDLYDHTLHLGSVWHYFPAFSIKRASKVSAGVSLWRHLRWQMIIRYFYRAEIIFFAFPSSQAELWSATLSDSASHLRAFKTPQFSYLLTFFKKSLTASEKILFCCPCFQLSAAKLLLSPVEFVSEEALQKTHMIRLWTAGPAGCSRRSLKWPGKSCGTPPFRWPCSREKAEG